VFFYIREIFYYINNSKRRRKEMKKKIMIIVSVLAITFLIGSISMAAPKDNTPPSARPVTIIRSGQLNVPAGTVETINFDTINATSIHWSAPYDEKIVSWLTPLDHPEGEPSESRSIFLVKGIETVTEDWALSFTSPVPINGFWFNCRNSTNTCVITYTIAGFSAE
jgi:hypothetical protein